MKSTNSTRIIWLDAARTIAIILVILCHVTENTYFCSGTDIINRSLFSQLFGFVLFSFGRLGVPIFLMISGYLLLSRSYDTGTLLKFWKNNLLPLFIASEIWIIVYYIFICYFNSQPFILTTLIKNMLFLGLEKISYLWYLPTILGLYLCLPFVAIALQKIDKKK